MKSIKHFSGILILVLLMVAGTSSCFFEGDEDVTFIDTGEGKAFRFKTAEIGPVAETDEMGQPTGRRGMKVDLNRDGKLDEFYQVPYPKVGIFGLGFDTESGAANASRTLGLVNLRPGKTHYELNLTPLVNWIRTNDIGKREKADHPDDYDKIYFLNPVSGEVEEGLLTGNSRRVVWDAYSAGLVTVDEIAGDDDDDDDTAGDDDTGDDDTGDDDTGDDDTADGALDDDDDTGDDDTGDDDTGDDDTGDDDTGDDDDDEEEAFLSCDVYDEICARSAQCVGLADNWDLYSCKEWSAQNWVVNEPRRYLNCIMDNCMEEPTCEDYANCRQGCFNTFTFSQFGCDASHGPEIVNTFYLLQQSETDQVGSQRSEGFTANKSSKFGVYFQYRDVEGDIAGGKIMVSFNGGEFEEAATDLPNLGESSFTAKAIIGFTLANPLPVGDHTFQAYIVDGCGQAGNTVEGAFTVRDEGSNNSNNAEFNGKIGTTQVEYYETVVDKFNEGKGVLAAPALPREYFYKIEGLEVGVLQSYIWFIQTSADKSDFTFLEINNIILQTTQSDGGTKYDTSDDSQASIFYFDEPMTPGVLLIWGDQGWNLFYQGPYGESDVAFIRGDFADHEIKLSTQPIYNVRDKYKGCVDNCEYWMDFIYREPDMDAGEPDYHTGLGLSVDDPDGDALTQEKAVQYCEASSADGYWACVLGCAKREEDTTFDNQSETDPDETGADRRCLTGEDCIARCEWDDVRKKSYCDEAQSINMKVKIEIPSYYLSKSSHVKRLRNSDESMKVGVWVQGAGLVPGAYKTFNPNVALYTIPLPNGDTIPNSLFSVSKLAEGQMQAYPALVTQTETSTQVWGLPYNEPNDLYDDNWYYLLIYGYNWFGPTLEGWSLYSVEPPYLQDVYDFAEKRITIRYGDLRAIDGDIMQ